MGGLKIKVYDSPGVVAIKHVSDANEDLLYC
jgi:hypothetical protein